MTNSNKIPALTIDSLATATITFYILNAATDDLADALARFDDESLADMTIDELNENELIFDLFIDSSISYDDNDIDAITDFDFHTDEFRDMIITAYRAARRA